MSYEPVIRLSAFLGIFALMGCWEVLAPRRERTLARLKRWPANLLIVAIDGLVVRLLIPVTAVGVAVHADASGWGLLRMVDVPPVPAIALSIVLLDGVVYLQHVMFHALPVLWRFHRVHHVDLDIDVTTGSRFHPVEIVLSMAIKCGAIVLLGTPAVAVVGFEVLLNVTAMFNHSNVRIPLGIDRWVRWLLVTPDMHRVHHSVERDETDSNFGFNLPWWDRLCGTYRAQPRAGHLAMTIGVRDERRPAFCAGLPHMLAMPFRRSGQTPPEAA